MTNEEIIADERYHTCGRCKWEDIFPPFICNQCKWGDDTRKDLWQLKEENKECISREEAIDVLKNDIEICTIQQEQACELAVKALEIELLTDKEQRIFLKAMDREREVCQKYDDEFLEDGSNVSLVKVCNSIERKVKKIWEI